MEAFERACVAAGGVKSLALKMSAVSGKEFKPSRVGNWHANGVPEECVIIVARAIDFEVTPHQLNGDMYPHPDDGVPPARRPALPVPQQPAALCAAP